MKFGPKIILWGSTEKSKLGQLLSDSAILKIPKIISDTWFYPVLKKNRQQMRLIFPQIPCFCRVTIFCLYIFTCFLKSPQLIHTCAVCLHVMYIFSFVSQIFSYILRFKKNIHTKTLNIIMINFHSNTFHFFNIHWKVRVNFSIAAYRICCVIP